MARILLVEDEMLCALLLRQWLSDEGHQVRLARDGAEGLATEAGWSPDLVVTDIRMPVMNGLEMAHHIRQRRPGLPLLFVTGSGQEIDPAEWRDAVLVDKPVTQRRFLAAVDGLLGESGAVLAA